MQKIAALIAALSLACVAQAEVVTFSYTAKIDHVFLYDDDDGLTQPSTATVRDRTVSEGDVVTGYFSIDTSTALIYQRYTSQNELFQAYRDSSSANALTSKIGSAGPVTDSTASWTKQISVVHAPTGGFDGLAVHSNIYQAENYFELARIDFEQRSTGPGSGIDTSLIALNQNSLYTYSFGDYTTSSFAGMSATGYLTSLTFISSVPSGPSGPSAPVPEADTYAMLLAGLGVLGWASRRQRRSREVS